MSEEIESRILSHLQSPGYRPQKPRSIAREIEAANEESFADFKDTLRELLDRGKVQMNPDRTVVMSPKPERAKKPAGSAAHRPAAPVPAGGAAESRTGTAESRGVVVGAYRHNRRGFGFVVPSEPPGHEDLFIPPGQNGGAIAGDIVRAKIAGSERFEGKVRYEGKVIGIVERTNTTFVGTLIKQHNEWFVLPDGNDFTDPILTPDAASRHIKPGTKVAVELTTYPSADQRAQGVITDVLGQAGEKDVDLRAIILQHGLPTEFPEECVKQARASLQRFNETLDQERQRRLDLTDEMIVTIDPDDAKDYDDAISLRQLPNGNWQLGVHIADVSFFVEPGSPLDDEAAERGNSAYFPGHVIPMLPEILSNGVCSLQEGVHRLCKSAFIELDEDARPVGTKFHNTVIRSSTRFRYREAQAILDGLEEIPHPDGPRKVSDYPSAAIELLHEMDRLAKRIQKRRNHDGQLVLQLPEIHLVLDEEGKVVGAVPEDESYTHTLIEMFMVEANEAVARLLDALDLPFLRRAHDEPPVESTERLRQFVQVAGYKLPKGSDRKAVQALLESVKGKPEAFAINLAALKSMSRAEYSPRVVGHYALASKNYCHFTSPIRRYADLTVHRLLDSYFAARAIFPGGGRTEGAPGSRKKKLRMENVPSYEDLVTLGKHISFTERRASDAENELRQVKVLELLKDRIGDEFHGVITSVTKFGIFIQLREYLIDGLIRYENMGGDYWEVDERAGIVRGRNTGERLAVGDLVTAVVANVDIPRRQLDVSIIEHHGHTRSGAAGADRDGNKSDKGKPPGQHKGRQPQGSRGGGQGGSGRGGQGRGGSGGQSRGGQGGQGRGGPGGKGRGGPKKSGRRGR